MNDTELLALCARLEGLLAKATPGKWDWDADAIKGDPLGRHRARICTIGKTITQAYYTDESGVNDAALIAAMKNALPALLRVAREGVEARNKALEEAKQAAAQKKGKRK